MKTTNISSATGGLTWPATSRCAVRGCGQIATYGTYCEDCHDELQALDEAWERHRKRRMEKAAARAGGQGYMRVARSVVRQFEWIGTLCVVSVLLAMVLIEFAPWFFDVARRFKDVVPWGK